MKAHEKRIDCLKNHIDKFCAGGTGFVGAEVKEQWVKSAIKNFSNNFYHILSIDDTKVVGLYETSLFGKGKEGILFTDDALLWKNSYNKGFVYLKDIDDIYFFDDSKDDKYKGIVISCQNKATVITDHSSNNVFWEGFCSLKCGAFITFMKEFIQIR